MKQNHSTTLRSHKLKVTDARNAILELLTQNKKPLDVEEIKQKLSNTDIKTDQATIYRILKMFVEKGIVHKVALQDEKVHYELSDRPHHHHIICISCGKIQDIEECGIEEMEKRIEKDTGFTIQSHSFELFGLCSDCKTK